MQPEDKELGQDETLDILLIEDDPGDVTIFEESIKSAHTRGEFPSFKLICKGTMRDTIDFLSSHSPSLVIIDLTLPDCYGFESFQSVRHLVPNTPIVVMTSEECAQLGLRSVRSGAQDYLIKGNVEPTALPRILLYAVERQKIRNQSIKYEL